MYKKFFTVAAIVTVYVLIAFLTSCDDDNSNNPTNSKYTPEQIARGKYLVMEVSKCAECHTPFGQGGVPDESKLLAGGQEFVPGKVWSSNITNDSTTGLGKWTDQQIINAIAKGYGHYNVNSQGLALFPIMPYYVFANMTNEDLKAIVAFLREGTPAINNQVTMTDAAFIPPQPSPALDYNALPGSGEGKYLTSAAGLCVECHTPRIESIPPNPAALDPTKYFAGTEGFIIPGIGTVESANITPDNETGIGDWTDQQIKDALIKHIDEMGVVLCPPMPIYAGLNSGDVDKIVAYLRSLPAIKNQATECP